MLSAVHEIEEELKSDGIRVFVYGEYICQCVCVSICLYYVSMTWLCAIVHVCLSICMSMCLYGDVSVCLCVCMSMRMYVCLCVSMSMCCPCAVTIHKTCTDQQLNGYQVSVHIQCQCDLSQ